MARCRSDRWVAVPERGRMSIPREYDEWLDIVAEVPEADLPCNQSTVAYAVRCALLLRDAKREAEAGRDAAYRALHRIPLAVLEQWAPQEDGGVVPARKEADA